MGKIYYSPYAAYEYRIRPRRDIFQDGVKVDEVRELTAEFATHRGEYSYVDHDGKTQQASDISGHYFDLDSQAEQKGWSPEEKELAEKRLDRACVEAPGEIRLYTKPAVGKPWPKYDATPWGSVADLADQLGLVAEAIAYEAENKNRTGVLKALSELKVADEPESVEVLEEIAAA